MFHDGKFCEPALILPQFGVVGAVSSVNYRSPNNRLASWGSPQGWVQNGSFCCTNPEKRSQKPQSWLWRCVELLGLKGHSGRRNGQVLVPSLGRHLHRRWVNWSQPPASRGLKHHAHWIAEETNKENRSFFFRVCFCVFHVFLRMFFVHFFGRWMDPLIWRCLLTGSDLVPGLSPGYVRTCDLTIV